MGEDGIANQMGMHWEGLSEKDADTVLHLCARIGERIADGVKGGIDG